MPIAHFFPCLKNALFIELVVLKVYFFSQIISFYGDDKLFYKDFLNKDLT